MSPQEDYSPAPAPFLSPDEYSRAEIARWLHRVERMLGELRLEVVSRGVYEVERREIERDIADLKAEMVEVRNAGERRHERLVARTWWVVAGLVTTALGVVGLFMNQGG